MCAQVRFKELKNRKSNYHGNGCITRRSALKALAMAGIGAVVGQNGCRTHIDSDRPWQSVVRAYLQGLARPDNGYAWQDQLESHLTPTFAVIGCYRILQREPPNPKALADFIYSHHPSHLKQLEQERRVFLFQQVQSLVWLNADVSVFSEEVQAWDKPIPYMERYERHGYPVFQSELSAFTCRALLGLPLNDLYPHFVDYLDFRRRANGSYNNTPAEDGSDGHVMNTWWGIQALDILGRSYERKEEIVTWVRACQLPNGGFTYQPDPEFGGWDDVAYTWAALKTLKLLGAEPVDPDGCRRYLLSLWHADGGFGDRSGWESNPMATYRALEALDLLDALQSASPIYSFSIQREKSIPADLNVYSVQIEAHGSGSPTEAVDLAEALNIHLWGAKNAAPGWIAQAQAIADVKQVPVQFFVSNEEYNTWVDVPGLGTYSHTSDLIAPAGVDFGMSLSNTRAVSWPEFCSKRLAPLIAAGGRLIWQFGENEELVRIFLDDSIQRGGFAAISTFHFGNPDFTNSEPFLQRYRGRIPFIALQDAHGTEPWWFADMTAGFRTLFLAREPTWDGWLNALRENWVVAVRHDAVSRFKTWMHGGMDEVIHIVQQHQEDWQWWDNAEIVRPLVSVVAIKPEDRFEVARPDGGVMIRVRCAWENTAQGLPKEPITELVRLIIDGKSVSPTQIVNRNPNNNTIQDHYHQFHLVSPESGKHTVEAVVRMIETGMESGRTITFTV